MDGRVKTDRKKRIVKSSGTVGRVKSVESARATAAVSSNGCSRMKIALVRTAQPRAASSLACGSHFLGWFSRPSHLLRFELSSSRHPRALRTRRSPGRSFLRSTGISSEKLSLRLTVHFLRLFFPNRPGARPSSPRTSLSNAD